MKGVLHKESDGKWFVNYSPKKSFPLHPDDLEKIYEWSTIFDNIDARIFSSPEVEFEVIDYSQTCKECNERVERGRNCSKGCFMKPGNFISTEKIEYAKLIHII